MDGKRRWIDNVMIERFWRSLKYEDIYLNSYENGWKLVTGRSKCTTCGRFKVYHPRSLISGLFSLGCQSVIPVGSQFCCATGSYAL
jgi:putative transposase